MLFWQIQHNVNRQIKLQAVWHEVRCRIALGHRNLPSNALPSDYGFCHRRTHLIESCRKRGKSYLFGVSCLGFRVCEAVLSLTSGCVKQAAGTLRWLSTWGRPHMFSTALMPWALAACASMYLPAPVQHACQRPHHTYGSLSASMSASMSGFMSASKSQVRQLVGVHVSVQITGDVRVSLRANPLHWRCKGARHGLPQVEEVNGQKTTNRGSFGTQCTTAHICRCLHCRHTCDHEF